MNYKVRLVDDARHFYKWSSTRWQAFLATLLLLAAYLSSLLQRAPEVLQWANNNWPSLQPLLAHYFPSVTQATWIVVAQVLAIVLRTTSIEKKPPVAP